MTVQTARHSMLNSDTADTDVPGCADAPEYKDATAGYMDLTAMLDRLFRRYMDVVRVQLETMRVDDITPPQALMLAGIGNRDIAVRDLIQCKGYQASTVSYNIRKLSEQGYLEQERAVHDRRSVRLRLSGKGRDLVARLHEMERRHMDLDGGRAGFVPDIGAATATLRRLDRIWAEFIAFG